MKNWHQKLKNKKEGAKNRLRSGELCTASTEINKAYVEDVVRKNLQSEKFQKMSE